jgi:PAS domain S-box-containing protein
VRLLRSLPLVFLLAAGGVSLFAAETRVPVTLQLKWRHQFQFAGYYAAIAQGYYREAGLDVTLREALPGIDPAEAVLHGAADFGVGASDLVLLRVSGKPVVLLASIFQHSPLVILARRDAGVQDLQSLAGRPIMIEPQSAELFAYFKTEGVDPARLRKELHTFDVKDLLSGRVAAMSAYITDEPFLLRQAGVDFLTFTPRAGGIDFYGDNLFTTEEQIRRRPAQVRAFREASLRGWSYALAHPDEIVELIEREYSRGKSAEHLRYEAAQIAQLMHADLIEVGQTNPGRWQHIAETYAEFGMIPQVFSLNGFIYTEEMRQDLRWFYWALAGLAAVLFAALGWILPLVRLNRRLHANERQYRALVEHAPFPVAITDLETSQVLFNNRRAIDLFGDGTARPLTELPATAFYENPADRERLLAGLRTHGLVTGMEIRFHARDGRPVWAQLSAGIVDFHGRRAAVVSFHDITRRRAIEDELRAAKEAAERADAAKGRYLGMLSHEIRTPLNGLLGVAGLMRTEQLTREGREHLEILERSGQTLLRLINDLLDFARYDSGRIELEQFAVEPAVFLKELCTLFRPAAEAKGLALTSAVRPEVPAAIVTDPMRLRQVLSNLLSNAIKFTVKGSVEIVVERAPFAGAAQGRCRLRFHVTDTGLGIPPEKMAHLFEPFVQADASVARRFGGTGLGLSISKRLAQLLGGGIRVQSTPGAGSMFTVEIEAEVAISGSAPVV